MLASFWSGEFLLRNPCCFFFLCFFSLFFLFFLSGEFALHIPCWLHFYLGSFSYTSNAGFIFTWAVSPTHPVLDSLISLAFLLHILCWLYFLFFFKSGELLLHVLCWPHSYLGSFYLGSFSYTSHAYFIFLWGVSITHPMLAFVLNWGVSLFFSFFFFNQASLPHTFRASFIFIWGVSLTHPVLASPLCGEFLLHILCWLYFYLGSFSYTSLASVFLSFFFFF